MPGRECYHCKQWIEPGEAHDCWTTTEAALTEDLAEDLRDAWERLRETAASFGEQRIYASHHSIMFSRKACYLFVRPKKSYLELCLFLGREVRAPQVKRVDRASASKVAHLLRISHRDEVESPITDWMREAYDLPDALAAARRREKTGANARGASGPSAGVRIDAGRRTAKAAVRVKARAKASPRPAGRKSKPATRKTRRR